jgi:glycosyltransferase involved in cell wall biosynthesis
MPIAYVTSQYPAPSHTFIRREVNELRLQGLDIHTFSTRPPSPAQVRSAEDKEAYASTYYLLPVNPNKYARAHYDMLRSDPRAYLKTFLLALKHRVPGVKAFFLAIAYFLEAIFLADELKRRRISHVHNHFANPSATVSMLAARFLGLPWSLTLHGHSETDYPAGVLLGAKLEACTFAACVSNFGRAQGYRVVDPKHWHKLFINRCALDLTVLPQAFPHVPGTPFRLISVARLSPEKGHFGLIQAFARARTPDCTLTLVGDGPERTRLEREVEDLGLTQHVIFKGALPESETLHEIAKSDALVLASFIEGLPVVLMEAMALGKPVVAPHLAGIPDMIQDEKNGLLFAPADWEHLAERLQLLFRDEGLRRRLSKAGRSTIKQDFEISRAVKPIAERLGANVSTEPLFTASEPEHAAVNH